MAKRSLYTRTAALLVLIVLGGALSSLRAQSVNVYFGMGTATDSASPVPLPTTPNPPDNVNSFARSSLGGVFGQFGADFMLTPHFGVGGEYAFRFAQADYVAAFGLKDRPGFYDFNLVYMPKKEGKILPVFQAGLGGARVSYYVTQQSCSGLTACSTSSSLYDQATHFQGHFSGGIRWNLTDNIFVRPQVDLHWVHGYADPNVPVYGRDWVPQFTVAIGYSFGAH